MRILRNGLSRLSKLMIVVSILLGVASDYLVFEQDRAERIAESPMVERYQNIVLASKSPPLFALEQLRSLSENDQQRRRSYVRRVIVQWLYFLVALFLIVGVIKWIWKKPSA